MGYFFGGHVHSIPFLNRPSRGQKLKLILPFLRSRLSIRQIADVLKVLINFICLWCHVENQTQTIAGTTDDF